MGGNEMIAFQARFGGVAQNISIPVDNVAAIYARENGHGMAFEVSASTFGMTTPKLAAPVSDVRRRIPLSDADAEPTRPRVARAILKAGQVGGFPASPPAQLIWRTVRAGRRAWPWESGPSLSERF